MLTPTRLAELVSFRRRFYSTSSILALALSPFLTFYENMYLITEVV